MVQVRSRLCSESVLQKTKFFNQNECVHASCVPLHCLELVSAVVECAQADINLIRNDIASSAFSSLQGPSNKCAAHTNLVNNDIEIRFDTNDTQTTTRTKCVNKYVQSVCENTEYRVISIVLLTPVASKTILMLMAKQLLSENGKTHIFPYESTAKRWQFSIETADASDYLDYRCNWRE